MNFDLTDGERERNTLKGEIKGFARLTGWWSISITVRNGSNYGSWLEYGIYSFARTWKDTQVWKLDPTPSHLKWKISEALYLYFTDSRQKKKSFLHNIVTGDEIWVYYDNPFVKKQWLSPGQTPVPTPKPGLHPKKVLLCIWWDIHGIIHYELLGEGEMVNSERYSSQLMRLKDKIDLKRPFRGKGKKKVILQHDNARPHVAKFTRQTIEELGWEVLPHPAYSPDLAPSDYHLFLGLKTFLREKSFQEPSDLEKVVNDYFELKQIEFFHRGIHELPKRW